MRRLALPAAALAALLAPQPLLADGARPDSLTFLLGSAHINQTAPASLGPGGFNEFNPGVIASWVDRGALGLTYSAGGFYNSYEGGSAILAVSDRHPIGGEFSAGWFAGVAYYGDDASLISTQIGSSDWVVLGGITVGYRNAFMQIMPTRDIQDDLGAILSFGFTVPLDN